MNALLSDKEIEAALSLIAEHLDVAPEKISPDARIADFNPDSLLLIELTMALEERFGLNIPEERWERVVTVGDVLELLGELLHPDRRAG